MRAVVISDTENRESVEIRDINDPIPGDDDVLVDVKACGVNFTDLLSLDGKYQNNPPPPFTPGKDAAGVVSAIGSNVTSHKIGDRVLAHVNNGAMAEKTVCHQALTCALPDGVAFEDAAAMGLAHLTAYFALTRRGKLQAGETVLINGASGGVGLAAVGLAKALGAKTVLAGLTSPGKADAIKAAGADAVIDLTVDDLKDGLRAQVAEVVGRQGVDMVVDMVGGAVFEASLRAIADEGRAVVVGFASGTIPAVRTNYLLLKNISVVGMTVNSYMKSRSPDIAKAQAALFELLKAGKIDPNIMARLPFDQFRDGIRTLEDRKIVGKTVLLM
ncbi:MAG: NADPH:quinone oxidoreductase family protein [Rhodospirillales bacterium]|nr:NADPH:quinone oxidoreductase family protein [Rhodospirillales bacterium]